jgi:hypothetical protein
MCKSVQLYSRRIYFLLVFQQSDSFFQLELEHHSINLLIDFIEVYTDIQCVPRNKLTFINDAY